jgi:hypothetical protein
VGDERSLMFDLEAGVLRAHRRELKERFERQWQANVDAWRHGLRQVCHGDQESLFCWGIEDLAYRSLTVKQHPCRGLGADFEACWPVSRFCPGVEACVQRLRDESRRRSRDSDAQF